MSFSSTPHISAGEFDFGKTVLMPGDPLRSKFIAETFLTAPRLVNNIRGVQGYTGTYDGVTVSVMASGMGMPSIGIYSHELFNFYHVDNIIRVGSAGAMQENIHVRDVVFGLGACSNSNYQNTFGLPGHFAPTCNYELLKTAVEIAEELKASYHVGNILSSDTFYDGSPEDSAKWQKMGVMAVEMEAAALYMNAAAAKKRALGIMTISDHLLTHEETTAQERETSFTQMIEIALKTAVKFG